MFHTFRVPRLLGRTAVAISIVVVVFSATNAAGASPKPNNTINQHYQAAGAQFSDCPSTPPAQETLCTGVDVFAERSVGTVAGPKKLREGDVQVGVAIVHLHPDGTFDLEPETSGGIAYKFHLDDFHQTKIRANVPLDDGSTAQLDITLKAVSAATTDSFTGDFFVPQCPSQSGHVTIDQSFKDAAAQGSVVVHGARQAPTSVLETPHLLDEYDTGTCNP